jgi:hypothetical protein
MSRKDIQLTPEYDLHTKCSGEEWQKKIPLSNLGLKRVNNEVLKEKCINESTGLSCLVIGSCGRIY